jgi:hypothetical protein
MNVLSNKERQEMKEEYYNGLLKEASQLNEDHKRIATVILHSAKEQNFYYQQSMGINQVLWRSDTKHLSDIFAGDELGVLEFLLGKVQGRLFKKIWDRATEYPFSQGYLRRSFRTNEDSRLYLSSNIDRLCAALNLVSLGISWHIDILFSEASNAPFLHDYLAYELDEGNTSVLNRLQEVIYGDNSNGLITRNIIKGMLMSHVPRAHRLIGELLLAAKLQEGLRQTIVECMDEASREGFIYILKIIIEEELWRFSSIVRAFDVWTGLPIEAYKPAGLKKCIKAAYDCLTNRDILNEYLNSEDSQLLYVALWACAFDELARTQAAILAIAQSNYTYRKIVALQFLTQCQAPEFQHKAAVSFMDDSELDVKAWAIPNLYPHVQSYHLRNVVASSSAHYPQGSSDEWRLFNQLQEVLNRISGKEIIIKSNGLFSDLSLSTDQICGRMLAAAYVNSDQAMCDILLDYRDRMLPETRSTLIRLGLQKPDNEKQRQALFLLLGDKSTDVRREAQNVVDTLELTAAEFLTVEELLQYKAGDIRKAAIYLLLKQPENQLGTSINRLLGDKKEDKRLGALDLVLYLHAKADKPSFYADCVRMVKSMSDSTARERILMDQIIRADSLPFDLANGYGLYDPAQQMNFAESLKFTHSSEFELKSILSTSLDELQKILGEWSELIAHYKDYEYEAKFHDGSCTKHILGTLEWGLIPLSYIDRGERKLLDRFPLAEVWRKQAHDQSLNAPRILELLFYYRASEQSYYDSFSLEKFLLQLPIPTVNKLFESEVSDGFARFLERLPYRRIIQDLLSILLNECEPEASFKYVNHVVQEIYESLIPGIEKYHKPLSEEELMTSHLATYSDYRNDKIVFPDIVKVKEVQYWLDHLKGVFRTKISLFEAGFLSLYRFARIDIGGAVNSLELLDYARALEMGLISENELYLELMGRATGISHIRSIFRDQVKKELHFYPKALIIIEAVIQRVVEIELKRGDSDTSVSRLAQQINRYEGMRYMVQCLLSLGSKDSLSRGYFYSWTGTTKKEMISHLLKSCHPSMGEDADTMSLLLQGHQISDKRLIDVAMYAPQWVSIIEDYLGWPGLSNTCWYFHAHVSELFSSEKETMVARYSPISPRDLNEGAFDIDWFLDAYRTIGEKRFELVYESAKYISDGANHRRAQLFSDAVLGRLHSVEIERELSEKRNKNHVLIYGMIPLNEDLHSESLIHRYEVLQKFAKESKQFGAQRRDSETKAVRLALGNLARNAGFPDVTRMTWRVEADQFKQISAHLEPIMVDQWQINLAIDEWGKASLKVVKDGKEVKSLPDKLKKNELVVQLKEFQTVLKDQYRRARDALEKAMVMEEPITIEELNSLQENKVIAPLINSLVFVSGETLGFYHKGKIKALDGQAVLQKEGSPLLIAHSVQLYKSGQWAAYQRDVITRQVVQPFKQVFRELYRPNADECLEGTASSRYAGHQIQPLKAAALFKSRQWSVSREEGLQKVFHKQDIIATMYALADWFSPADIEAPTIEKVAFYNRRSGKPVHLTEVPAVIFSEVMRDIDLVVSVAHVGGVDPEASLSTVEMRASLLHELLPLMKLSNVEIKGSHAHIVGKLGEYTVHLGSGMVHRIAAGALYIIPIHSQHRGRIFLPFVDEDPRTAEIASKVLLLAEDHKLKDPTILAQIKD